MTGDLFSMRGANCIVFLCCIALVISVAGNLARIRMNNTTHLICLVVHIVLHEKGIVQQRLVSVRLDGVVF